MAARFSGDENGPDSTDAVEDVMSLFSDAGDASDASDASNASNASDAGCKPIEGKLKHSSIAGMPEMPMPPDTSAPANSPGPEEKAPTLRLLFSCEDGGMLIGKGGRHIAMLKEATSA
ncbi:hypothetical protein LPJ61_002544, partial [Coemansia biformis]